MDRTKPFLLVLARTAVLVMAAFTLVVAVQVLGETNRPVPSGRILLVRSADLAAGALPPGHPPVEGCRPLPPGHPPSRRGACPPATRPSPRTRRRRTTGSRRATRPSTARSACR